MFTRDDIYSLFSQAIGVLFLLLSGNFLLTQDSFIIDVLILWAWFSFFASAILRSFYFQLILSSDTENSVLDFLANTLYATGTLLHFLSLIYYSIGTGV